MSQSNGIGATQDTQQEASTVATPAGKEASSVDPSLSTPASALGSGSGSSPTPNNASPTARAQQGSTSPSAADADAMSVKQLIQQRTSSSAVSAARCIVCGSAKSMSGPVGNCMLPSVARVLCKEVTACTCFALSIKGLCAESQPVQA